jgi:hypothetical protein
MKRSTETHSVGHLVPLESLITKIQPKKSQAASLPIQNKEGEMCAKNLLIYFKVISCQHDFLILSKLNKPKISYWSLTKI